MYIVCGRVKNRGPCERRERSGWKGRLGSKGSGRVVNGRPEECVQPSDELSLGPRKGFQKLGAIQKTSGVGTLVKRAGRSVQLSGSCPLWAGDGPGLPAVPVPILSVASIQSKSIPCSALQAFGFVT